MEQRKRHISITTLLVSTVGGLVALSISVVLGLSYMANLTNTTELLEQSSSQLIKRIEQHITSQINPARYVVDHIATQAASSLLDLSDKSELTPTLRAVLAAAPELTGVDIWQPDGYGMQVRRQIGGKLTIKTATNRNNPNLKAFLNRLKAAKEPVWDEPLRIDGVSFISVSSPIFRYDAHLNGSHPGSTYLGAVSASISITSLSSAIREIVKGTAFTGFILYDDDFVLAHKNLPSLSTTKLSNTTPLHSVKNIGDDVLANYASGEDTAVIKSVNFKVRVVTVNNSHHVVISHPIKLYGSRNWRVGVHVPQEQINTQMRRIMLSLLAGLGLLALSIVATVILARQVAKPIKSISSAATRISTLDLDKVPNLSASRIRELDNQSHAFNQMLDGLKWFEAYVPRKLVERLIKGQNSEAVVSRQEDLTVMFTDLVGFTKMSEKLTPADTANMLNQHFELINSCIEETDGTLDKYIGDAVMAFWGAPEAQEDHALRACESALCIAERLEQEDTGLRVKIALHSGPLIVGNIGARDRMNYTVIGDTVNTCSRIETLAGDLMAKDPQAKDLMATDPQNLNKALILISKPVAEAVKGKFYVEPAGEFSVKGRENRVIVYRLIGRNTGKL